MEYNKTGRESDSAAQGLYEKYSYQKYKMENSGILSLC